MNLSTSLAAIARVHPSRPAVSEGEQTLDYVGFEDQVRRIAGGLLGRHGLGPGARVGLWMENTLSYLPLLLGIWRAGLTAVPINARLHPKELAWILENSGAGLCFVTEELAGKLAELPAGTDLPPVVVTGTDAHNRLLEAEPHGGLPTDPGADAWLFYTSGTTGRPKGARLSHRNLLFAVQAYYADIDFLGPEDTTFHAAPLSHGSGLYGLAFVLKGGHNVIVPGSFDPDRILHELARHRSVSLFAAPTMVTRLVNHPRIAAADTSSLRTITYGGAPMYVSDLERALSLLGPKLYQVYGQGESPMTITGLAKAMHAEREHPAFKQRLGSAGTPRTGVAVRIVDETGNTLPPGEIGEIVTTSDCVMQGYWRNDEANARAIRDGWLWTGDLGSMDEAGFLTLKDRSKDMIISGGSNIYPREIEEVLLTHADVLEAAVVSRPHADWGEEVIAFVVARPGTSAPTPAELDRLCLDNIARYKRPKGYRVVASLPKNNYGKILKTELRELLAREG
jgi:long-chain acyl-CoA synthetase